MITTDDVNRMRDQRDVEGLIQFLQSDNDPQIRKHAAFALGMVGDSRARVVLQNCMLNDDPIVAGAASAALGQLEAKLATGSGVTQIKPVTTKSVHKKNTNQKSGGCAASFWDLFRVFVVIVWVTVGFSILMGMFEAVNSVEEMGGWGFIILFIVVFIGMFLVLSLGFRALYRFSSKRLRMAKGELPKEKPIAKPSQASGHRSGESVRELVAGDVLAMAIVYEGYVVEEPNPEEIGQELLKNFSDAGILEAVNLHPHTVIQMRRADEVAYYQGDYEPGDELPQMLEKGIVELKNRLVAEGQGLGKVSTRMVSLKGKSRIVSNCWVAMHIMQS